MGTRSKSSEGDLFTCLRSRETLGGVVELSQGAIPAVPHPSRAGPYRSRSDYPPSGFHPSPPRPESGLSRLPRRRRGRRLESGVTEGEEVGVRRLS